MLFRKKAAAVNPQQRRLSKEYIQLTERLAQIRTAFDLVTEEDVIDSLIFEENAVLARLTQLYKEARSEGLTLSIFEFENAKNKKI